MRIKFLIWTSVIMVILFVISQRNFSAADDNQTSSTKEGITTIGIPESGATTESEKNDTPQSTNITGTKAPGNNNTTGATVLPNTTGTTIPENTAGAVVLPNQKKGGIFSWWARYGGPIGPIVGAVIGGFLGFLGLLITEWKRNRIAKKRYKTALYTELDINLKRLDGINTEIDAASPNPKPSAIFGHLFFSIDRIFTMYQYGNIAELIKEQSDYKKIIDIINNMKTNNDQVTKFSDNDKESVQENCRMCCKYIKENLPDILAKLKKLKV